MAFPTHADYLIIGAGIHGLSTAWRLAERLSSKGEAVEGRARHEAADRGACRHGVCRQPSKARRVALRDEL